MDLKPFLIKEKRGEKNTLVENFLDMVVSVCLMYIGFVMWTTLRRISDIGG